jgi:hypothetical protein
MAGGLAWFVLHPLLAFLPEPARFLVAWVIFTAGPGLALGAHLTRGIDPLQGTIIQMGLGSAAVPVLVELVGRPGSSRFFLTSPVRWEVWGCR